MKPGFGNKKQKKQKKKDRKKAADGDDTMADAAPTAAAPSPEPTMADAPQVTAKGKQRQRMELKNALKVQVATLKSKRNKLTKLAGNRTERRQLNSELKGLVEGQLSKGKAAKGQKQQAAAAAGAIEAVMAE